MAYVDGYVVAVPAVNKEAYIEHAKEAIPIFKEYGALSATECWGDDVPAGENTSLPLAVKLKEDETVVFSWMVWPSKEARNKGLEEMMKDPCMQPGKAPPPPFDGGRMIFGGFEVVVQE